MPAESGTELLIVCTEHVYIDRQHWRVDDNFRKLYIHAIDFNLDFNNLIL
jgi:hypothetical protein